NFDPLAQGNRINHIWGEAKLNDASIFLNGDYPINDNISAYIFGGYSHRAGKSAGFYRLASDSRNVPAIYPNGFLPFIETDINDFSASAGVKGSVSDWTYDLSETYGTNSLAYRVTNSLNTSYWAKSPTDFDAGTLKFGQATTNLDIFRAVDIGREFPLDVAVGGEFRYENYQILAGEVASYAFGDSTKKAKGAQVFPGFAPADAKDKSRTNVGAYIDLEHKLSNLWLVSVAGRAENYSDFGSTVTGKFSTRYDVAYGFAVRGAASTGFRAPSLAQSYFSAVSTNFIGGVPYDIITAPVNTSLAKALGASKLKAEKSVNLSVGLTYDWENLSFSADVYRIDITDRIVFTENFIDSAKVGTYQPTNVSKFLANQGFPGIGGGRFFTNAVNTKTQGMDITGRYGIDLSDLGKLRLTAAINFTKTEIINKDDIQTPEALKAITSIPLFGRVQQALTEVGQPRSTYNFIANYDYNDLGVLLRTVRYGDVTTVQIISDPVRDQTYSAKWLTDAEVSYRLLKNYVVAVGVDNIFDVYPDKVLKINSNNGIQQYSGQSPFGFNGRFVYARASVKI
ncbi:MAG: TonB-dependent receptor, partial [Bacteroidota bacterium]|nr:TonB-dependent receptor [Bacteroidota bacterium]